MDTGFWMLDPGWTQVWKGLHLESRIQIGEERDIGLWLASHGNVRVHQPFLLGIPWYPVSGIEDLENGF